MAGDPADRLDRQADLIVMGVQGRAAGELISLVRQRSTSFARHLSGLTLRGE